MNERFDRAIALIDEENSRDPNKGVCLGEEFPRELLYSRRLTDWLLRLEPNPSEALLLAARSQHIARWKIPRSQYPEGRTGYLQWRNELKRFHASCTSEILMRVGYDQTVIDRVRSLNLKQGFPSDAETQVLEDALCLVFLEFQFSDLAARLDPEKMLIAVRKSWGKMSAKARNLALKLPFSPAQKTLIDRALLEGQVLP